MPPLSLPENKNSLPASVTQEPISGSYKYLSFTTASHGSRRLKQSQIRRSKGTIVFDGAGACVLNETEATRLTERYSKDSKRVRLAQDSDTLQETCTYVENVDSLNIEFIDASKAITLEMDSQHNIGFGNRTRSYADGRTYLDMIYLIK